jgi:hypothetical protein
MDVATHRIAARSGAGTEKRARTPELTEAGFPVWASMGHHTVRAFARTLRSVARSNSVWRSNLIRLAAPTHVLAMMPSILNLVAFW